jgi:Short C-terminal domain
VEETPIAVFRLAPPATPAVLRLYEQEIEVSHGRLLSVTRQRVRYNQIAQVLVKRGLLYTTLAIESTGGHTLEVTGMTSEGAQAAREAIQERMRTTASLGSTTTPNAETSSIGTVLRELAELKEAGIITEAEFEAKKKELLDRL